jgi:hypothetical protein
MLGRKQSTKYLWGTYVSSQVFCFYTQCGTQVGLDFCSQVWWGGRLVNG